jgi:hypothetical protein
MFRLPRPSGSLSEGRPLSRPAPRSNKKNITDIRGADANRGPGPLSEAPSTRPRHRSPSTEGSSARPSGHSTHSRLRERHFHDAAPLKRFSRAKLMRREPGAAGSHLSRTASSSRRLSASGRSWRLRLRPGVMNWTTVRVTRPPQELFPPELELRATLDEHQPPVTDL